MLAGTARSRLRCQPAPSRHHHHMSIGRARRGDMIEEDLHRFGVDGGKDQRDVLARGGADRGEDGGPRVAELPGAGRALAPPPPAVADPALVADPRLVPGSSPGQALEPQLDPLARVARGGFGYPVGKAPFLKRSCASASRRGWWAAPVSREKPSRPSTSVMLEGWLGPAEPPFEPAAEIGARPGAASVLDRIGAAQDHRCKLRLLLQREPPRRPPPRPVPEPGETFGLVAQHRVAQRLAPHAREPRRLRPAQAVERMSDRLHPRRRPPILLPTGRPPNAVGRKLPSDLQRHSHGPLPHPRENRITQRSSTEPLNQVMASSVSGGPRRRGWPDTSGWWSGRPGHRGGGDAGASADAALPGDRALGGGAPSPGLRGRRAPRRAGSRGRRPAATRSACPRPPANNGAARRGPQCRRCSPCGTRAPGPGARGGPRPSRRPDTGRRRRPGGVRDDFAHAVAEERARRPGR